LKLRRRRERRVAFRRERVWMCLKSLVTRRPQEGDGKDRVRTS
jgi:hypothetical protein